MLLYTTYKYCSIKSRSLGLFYYIGIASVIVYTIITLIVNKGYLRIDASPHGSIALISDSLNGNLSVPYEHYCCHGNDTCDVPCYSVDGKELAWPIETDAVTISTFFKERRQTIIHDTGNILLSNEDEVKYYAKTPEAMDIKVEHSIHSYLLGVTGTQRTMSGRLLDSTGTYPIKTFTSRDRADRISLHDFIRASPNFESLDDRSDSPNGNGRSFRRKGCLLLVTITYDNMSGVWFGTSSLTYTYTVERVPLTPYRVEDVTYSPDYLAQSPAIRYTTPHGRLLRKRYGVHVKFTQVGTIGVFSFGELIHVLAMSGSLVTLITGVGDIIALYLLPQSPYYRHVIYGMGQGDLVDHSREEEEEEERKKK